jgi:hypothetical protein
VASFTSNLLGSRSTEPTDIEERVTFFYINSKSCAKLRNIAFAMSKIREMYKMMNVSAIKKNVENHKKTMDLDKRSSPDEGFVSGAFKIYVAYAENLKPTLKNGSSNPYLFLLLLNLQY